MPGARQMPAHERNAKERFLGSDAKLRGQVAEHGRNVHVTLVRGEKDIRRVRLYVMRAVNAHARAYGARNHPAPVPRAPMLLFARAIMKRQNQGETSHHERVEIYERDGYE